MKVSTPKGEIRGRAPHRTSDDGYCTSAALTAGRNTPVTLLGSFTEFNRLGSFQRLSLSWRI